jgi:nucleotide-binding universal stress UspA family protein
MSEYFKNSTILVPLKGHHSDEEVMRMAASIAKRNHARLYAVHVVVVPQEFALESEQPDEMAFGEQVLEKAVTIAQEYGVEIEPPGILQARQAGVAIVEEAIERGARLIIMAVTYRDRRGVFDMGRTVPYVLRNAPCRVWIYREEQQKGM